MISKYVSKLFIVEIFIALVFVCLGTQEYFIALENYSRANDSEFFHSINVILGCLIGIELSVVTALLRKKLRKLINTKAL